MRKDSAPPAGSDDSGTSRPSASLKPMVEAAQQSNKLFQFLVSQIIRVFSDKTIPPQLKLLLIPVLFIVPLYSLMIIVFLGNLLYCIARDQDMSFSYYLLFMGTTGPLTIAILLPFGILSNRFENSRSLEEQLQSVTDARQPRRRAPRSAG